MALVSKLIQSGFARRQAQAIGLTYELVVAAGTNQATAAQINESITLVTGADATKGVILPTYDLSKTGIHYVINIGTDTPPFGNSLKVYPAVNQIIVKGNGDGFPDASRTMASTTAALFILGSSGYWYMFTMGLS